MNDQMFNLFMKTYEDFKTRLLKNLNSSDKSLFIQNSEDCYIIEENWINEYINYFNRYNKNDSSFKSNISFSKKGPIFINDLTSIILILKNENNLKIINKKLLGFLFSEKDLIKIPIIKYYGGNNKIIVEYKDKKDDKALLIINPLNKNAIFKRLFILSIDNKQKLILYKDLLSEENNSKILSKKIYKKFVISFENYINKLINKNHNNPQKQVNQNLSNSINYNKINESFKKEILKILIYIFYYKKYLIEEKEKVFSENFDYYIINPEWINKYLEFYDYQNLKHSLLNTTFKNLPIINYNNINKYINNFIDFYIKQNLINFEKEKLKDLLDIQKIFANSRMLKNNFFFNNCFIIHSNLFNIISKLELSNKIFSNYKKKIYVNNKDIYFIDLNNIIIGNLNKDIFIPQYIFSYNALQILESERNIISSKKIEDYIKLRNCDTNNNNEKQNLISQNSKIGLLIIFNNAIIFSQKNYMSKSINDYLYNKNSNFSISKSNNSESHEGYFNRVIITENNEKEKSKIVKVIPKIIKINKGFNLKQAKEQIENFKNLNSTSEQIENKLLKNKNNEINNKDFSREKSKNEKNDEYQKNNSNNIKNNKFNSQNSKTVSPFNTINNRIIFNNTRKVKLLNKKNQILKNNDEKKRNF